MNNPEYAENIIVGIFSKNIFNWYVLDKILCLLDLKYMTEKELELYMNNESCNSVRNNFITIDQNDVESFLPYIRKNMIMCQELQLMILDRLKNIDNCEIDDFFPVLYFDFDKKILYSQYPEYFDFESFLPEKWNFIYEDFSNLLNEENKYWIYKGKDIFDIGIKKIEELKEKSKREKYNPENIFKNINNNSDSCFSNKVVNEMIEYKESFLIKIKNKIKSILKNK